MHRPTTLNPFGPIRGSFWNPKMQKIKWNQYCGTPCSFNYKARLNGVGTKWQHDKSATSLTFVNA